MYNTVPAEDTRLQEAPKSWKLKKIVVVSAALSFALGLFVVESLAPTHSSRFFRSVLARAGSALDATARATLRRP